MSCEPLIIELFTGPPGSSGAVSDITGDLTISVTNMAKVTGIQDTPVDATPPTTNQLFAFDGTKYTPTTFTAGTY